MAVLDAAKEELGWLKVVFAVCAAIDASLIAWLSLRYGSGDFLLNLLAFVIAAMLTVYIVSMNVVAYRRIRELKDLR